MSANVVLVFVAVDCPISNRYAPEVQRIEQTYAARGVELWRVYPDAADSPADVRRHLEQFGLSGRVALDPHHVLVARTGATVTPEAAVFDARGRMVYRGRIDDRFVDFGKTRPAATSHDLDDVLAALTEGEEIEPRTTRAVGCFIQGTRAES